MAESVEVGRRVRLPSGAERPIQVFVNGREQAEGADYTLHGREIVFSRPLVKEKVSSNQACPRRMDRYLLQSLEARAIQPP